MAAYRPLFPYYGLDEVEAERRPTRPRNGTSSQRLERPPLLSIAGRFDADE